MRREAENLVMVVYVGGKACFQLRNVGLKNDNCNGILQYDVIKTIFKIFYL